MLDSDDPLYPSNHEARSVSNQLLIILDRKYHCTTSPKDSHISLFFSRVPYCVLVNRQLTRAHYFQVFDEIEQ